MYNSNLDKTTKAELKTNKDKRVKLQAFDSSYFREKSHFKALSQSINTLKRLVVEYIFQRGNLKHCLIKVLKPLLYLIIVLLYH